MTSQKANQASPALSAVLAGGAVAEIIYDPASERTRFLVSRDGRVEEKENVDVPGRGPVVPYSPRNPLLRAGVILLPSAAAEYGSSAELIAAVKAFLHRYADLSEGFEEIAAHYVLLTWVYDRSDNVPYLRLRGDFGTGKSRCLQSIGYLCYKPILASGASTLSPLFRMLDEFRGTLIIDEGDFRTSDAKADIVKILCNGSSSGFPVLRTETTTTKEFRPRAFNVYGPKVIATRGPFEDPALESRCITEVMGGLPPRPEIPLCLPKEFQQEARDLRNQLLMYRFRNLHDASNPTMNLPDGIEPRVAQVLGPLGAIVQDPGAASRLRDLARGMTDALLATRTASIEAELLGIIMQMGRDGVPLGVKEICDRFRAQHGEDYGWSISPRWIGAQLRGRLGLTPGKRHGTFEILPGDHERLEVLFERYGLKRKRGTNRLAISHREIGPS